MYYHKFITDYVSKNFNVKPLVNDGTEENIR